MKKTRQNCLELVVILASLIGFSSQSLALINLQAGAGMENLRLKGEGIGGDDVKFSGTQLRASLLLDPIPLVPIGFGLGLTKPQINGKDSSDNKITMEGLLVDVHVMAWSPIALFRLKPYAKVGYIVSGGYKVDHSITNEVSFGGTMVDTSAGEQKYTYGFKSSGLELAVGARFALIPMVGLLLEVSTRNETAKPIDVKVAGQEVTTGLKEVKLASTNVMLGLEVGL